MLKKLLSKFYKKEIYRLDEEKYLTRYYLIRKRFYWMPGVYLHCFHAGDHDMELHDHPWARSFSFILKGRYLEEYRVGNEVKQRILSPGMFNFVSGDKFHRVDLLDKQVWTIFVSGARVKDWGFWCRYTDKYTPHKLFFERDK